jgi:superfamily II DNA helicase RecQ
MPFRTYQDTIYRQNIFLNVVDIPHNPQLLDFLVKEIRDRGRKTPKTIIFVNQVEECKVLYYYLWSSLEKSQRASKESC